jgi:antitoxin component YwqK of YwqJK toxin-antitoxin module
MNRALPDRRDFRTWLGDLSARCVGLLPPRTRGEARERRLGGRLLEEAPWREGLREGTYRAWFVRGSPRCEAQFERGLLHGVFRAWYRDGAPREESHYRQGRLHGRSTVYFRGGAKRAVGEFVDGKRTGEWFYFLADGRLDARRTGMYADGLRFSALRGFNDWNP